MRTSLSQDLVAYCLAVRHHRWLVWVSAKVAESLRHEYREAGGHPLEIAAPRVIADLFKLRAGERKVPPEIEIVTIGEVSFRTRGLEHEE